jgi:hypothetical protein
MTDIEGNDTRWAYDIQGLVGITEGGDNVEDKDLGRRMILKCFLNK